MVITEQRILALTLLTVAGLATVLFFLVGFSEYELGNVVHDDVFIYSSHICYSRAPEVRIAASIYSKLMVGVLLAIVFYLYKVVKKVRLCTHHEMLSSCMMLMHMVRVTKILTPTSI